MTYRTEMILRRCLAVVAGTAGLAWMAWDSYVLYQILLAVR